ncbi:hypothetical protein RQP46_006283 [Phenoliferia psychrophenolica]
MLPIPSYLRTLRLSSLLHSKTSPGPISLPTIPSWAYVGTHKLADIIAAQRDPSPAYRKEYITDIRRGVRTYAEYAWLFGRHFTPRTGVSDSPTLGLSDDYKVLFWNALSKEEAHRAHSARREASEIVRSRLGLADFTDPPDEEDWTLTPNDWAYEHGPEVHYTGNLVSAASLGPRFLLKLAECPALPTATQVWEMMQKAGVRADGRLHLPFGFGQKYDFIDRHAERLRGYIQFEKDGWMGYDRFRPEEEDEYDDEFSDMPSLWPISEERRQQNKDAEKEDEEASMDLMDYGWR